MQQPIINIPEALLASVLKRRIRAEITATEPGIMHGIEALIQKAADLGLEAIAHVGSGASLASGQKIASLQGNPVPIITGEDHLLGLISKASGIATMAGKAVEQAGGIRVVSGGWKKIPPEMKAMARAALQTGGVGMRLLDQPFLYLDKNYLRVFGSVAALLKATAALPDRAVSVQIRGETAPIGDEAVEAATCGAKVIMVDTGQVADLRICSEQLKAADLRDRVRLAFAGEVRIADLPVLRREDVDIVDIGKAILDAPLLDFRYDVVKER